MRQTGELVDWNDDRGFGFIRAASGAKIFVHISAIAPTNGATRPRIGDRLSFDTAPGRDGRPSATHAMITGANPAPTSGMWQRGGPQRSVSGRRLAWRFTLALSIAGLVALASALHPALVVLAGVYCVMSLVSLVLYYSDKQRAEANQWRISEATLHGVDLVGGIIGGLVAQELFRHKTAKREFIAVTVLIAIVHLVVLAALASGQLDLATVLDAMGL